MVAERLVRDPGHQEEAMAERFDLSPITRARERARSSSPYQHRGLGFQNTLVLPDVSMDVPNEM